MDTEKQFQNQEISYLKAFIQLIGSTLTPRTFATRRQHTNVLLGDDVTTTADTRSSAESCRKYRAIFSLANFKSFTPGTTYSKAHLAIFP